MKRIALIGLLVAVTACNGRVESVADQPESDLYGQELHLASLANGAVVIDRSGEIGLRHSAVMPLDGSVYTGWFSSPSAPEQWMIVRLPATSRVDGVRVITHHAHPIAPRVRVEGSLSGNVWRELAEVEVDPGNRETAVSVDPVDVGLLRVTMIGSGKEPSGLTDLVVTGTETGPRNRVTWAGSWRLNQRDGELVESGAMVHGTVPFLRAPMRLIGRPRNGFLPFAWSMGYATGYGFVSASAEGELSGYWAWDEHFDWQIAESWFGRRSGNGGAMAAIDRRAFALDFLRRGRGAPFFELVEANGQFARGPEAQKAIEVIREIVESNPELRFRLTAFDVEGVPSAETLVRESLQALRRSGGDLPNLELAVTAGNMLEQPPSHAQSRALYQRMDLEIGSSAAGNTPPIVLR